MRVLHLIKTPVGAAWAQRQIRELVKLGIEVHVALPPSGPMVRKYADAGATEHILQTDFPIRRPWLIPFRAALFAKLIQKVKPDLVHSHFVGTTLTMRLCPRGGKKIPQVFQVPGPLHLESGFFRRAELATAGSMDYWIGSCRWTCGRYQKSGISSERIFLSYYGTDTDLFVPRESGRLRKELGLGPECKIIGMVAYMYAPKHYLGQRRGLKGHEDLIDAFRLCLDKNPDLRCIVVGGAWNNATAYQSEVMAYGQRKCGNKLVFLGNRTDVADLYADFDVAVHPSHSENVGGAVESLLLGVPTIATRVGGFPDLVQDNITGWLVPPKNPPAIACAILDALSDPNGAKEKATAGQKLARELFDVRQTAREIKEIYERILQVQ